MGDQLMPEVQVQNDEAEAHEQLDYAVKEHPGTRVLGPGHNKTRSNLHLGSEVCSMALSCLCVYRYRYRYTYTYTYTYT